MTLEQGAGGKRRGFGTQYPRPEANGGKSVSGDEIDLCLTETAFRAG